MRRESKRQQFIYTTLAHMEALGDELAANPKFLDDTQAQMARAYAARLVKAFDEAMTD